MPSNHLILCKPFLLPPSIFPSIRVFSNESVIWIRWPKYWSFSFSISPSNGYSGLISFRIDWFELLAIQGIFKSLLQQHNSKASIILQHSAFFMVQLSHPYMTTEKTTALTILENVHLGGCWKHLLLQNEFKPVKILSFRVRVFGISLYIKVYISEHGFHIYTYIYMYMCKYCLSQQHMKYSLTSTFIVFLSTPDIIFLKHVFCYERCKTSTWLLISLSKWWRMSTFPFVQYLTL